MCCIVNLFNKLVKISTNPNESINNIMKVFNEFKVYAYYNTNDDELLYLDTYTRDDVKRFLDNLDNENASELNKCICGIHIHHCFQIINKYNGNIVTPIGRICINKFLPNDEKQIINELFKVVNSIKRKKRNAEKKEQKRIEKELKRNENKNELKKLRKELKNMNKKLDNLLFDIKKLNSKRYIDNYIKALRPDLFV